jgi:flagellar motor switch/type III secretory pathway protein FliN
MAAAGQAVSPTAAEKPQATAGETDEARWRPVLSLPCQLTVDLPLARFKVADFVKLHAGCILATSWRVSRDVPLRINGTLIAWGEFEGSGKRLAVRLTELA